MKLPYCRCGAKSLLTKGHAGFNLHCTKCSHEVIGHPTTDGAITAFLWQPGDVGDALACGCPLSGCTHPMFEVAP